LLQGGALDIQVRLLPSGIRNATKASWALFSMHAVGACNPHRDAQKEYLYPRVQRERKLHIRQIKTDPTSEFVQFVSQQDLSMPEHCEINTGSIRSLFG